MSGWSIRTRVLALALLPAATGTLLLALYFSASRLDDLERALADRGAAIARQLAPASEFGVFSDNRELLARLAQAALAEPDVAGIAVTDPNGAVIVEVGAALPAPVEQPQAGRLLRAERNGGKVALFGAPIVQALTTPEDPLLALDARAGQTTPRVVGGVYVQMSRDALAAQKRKLLASGALIAALVMLGATLLAWRLGRDVADPIADLARAVQRIGQGDLGVQVAPRSRAELLTLERGLNDMVAALRTSRGDLEGRIARATAELEVKRREAEQASTSKTRFLAAASHDLRQPMHALGLLVNVLRLRAASGPNAQLAAQIEQSVLALQRLLDALLDISRLDAGGVVAARSVFALTPLFERLRAEHAPVAHARQLAFRVHDTAVFVYSDPLLLERMLRNLVANAVRYTRAGGVLLGCRKRGERAVLEVWDTGSGIPPAETGRIFEEFYQIGDAERDREQGLGLGLAIVQRLGRLLGHEVTLASRVGRGSVFRVGVPLATEAPGAPGAHPGEGGDDRHLAGRVVVVVDDDAEVRRAMKTLLEQWGCRAIVADSAADAIAQLAAAASSPEAIIADYRLRAGMTGLDAIRSIRGHCARDVPAMVVTGDAAERLAGEPAGAYLRLNKPIQPGRLRAALGALLARRA